MNSPMGRKGEGGGGRGEGEGGRGGGDNNTKET